MTMNPHAVVIPWPGQGHINPLLHFSRRLAVDLGFSITFVNFEYTHARVLSAIRRQEEEEEQQQQQQDNPQLPPSSKLDIRFVSLPDGVTPDSTRTSDTLELCKGVARSSADFQRLLEELQPPPSCIISDSFVPHTQDAVNKLGIPRASFWTQSVASYASHLAAAQGRIKMPSGPCDEKLITDIPGAPPLRFKDLPSFLQLPPSDFMFDISVRAILRMPESACVLMNTFDALEGKALDVLRQQQPDCTFYAIGPALPVEYFTGLKLSRSFINRVPNLWPEDFTCMEWLDKQEEGSVLYVSFGSITELTGEEMEEFAMGLEATGVPVLWVLRPGLLEDGAYSALPEGFKQRNEGDMVIFEWVPQLHVLAHPAIRAFLTHAGWNSMLEAVAQGKPMVGFPYFADQMLNCRCMEELWCNGLALQRHGEGLLTRTLVKSTVQAVMTDASLHEAALRLRDAARLAVLDDGPGSSTANLYTIVGKLCPNLLQSPSNML